MATRPRLDEEYAWIAELEPVADEADNFVNSYKHRTVYAFDRYQAWMDAYSYPYREGKGWETYCYECGQLFWNMDRGKVMDKVEAHVVRNCQPPTPVTPIDYSGPIPY